MNIETKWLKDFVVLAQTRNFSKAAEIRHVSQPASQPASQHLATELKRWKVN